LCLLDEHPEIILLFTDVGLPGGLNGRQLADQARRLRPELRLLFTTGYARNAIVREGRLAPASSSSPSRSPMLRSLPSLGIFSMPAPSFAHPPDRR